MSFENMYMPLGIIAGIIVVIVFLWTRKPDTIGRVGNVEQFLTDVGMSAGVFLMSFLLWPIFILAGIVVLIKYLYEKRKFKEEIQRERNHKYR